MIFRGIVFSLLSTLSFFACQHFPSFRQKSENQSRDPSRVVSKSTIHKIESIAQPKKSVAVFDFWNDTPVKQDDFGVFAAQELKRGLDLSQRVVLFPEAKSELRTDGFVDENQVKVKQLLLKGRELGVSILVVGKIKRIIVRQKGGDVGLFRKKHSFVGVELESKVFDSQSGRELIAIDKLGEAIEDESAMFDEVSEHVSYPTELVKIAIREAVAGLISGIIKATEKITWQGRIVKLTGHKIYINAGRASGLISGDILKVLGPGEDIYDPASGVFLGRSEGQLKGTLEIIDFIGAHGAISHVHTGGSFQEGDLVQLY